MQKQKKPKTELTLPQALPAPETAQKEALDISATLDKINALTEEPDKLVWTCLTRLTQGGCLRFKEGRPPLCPIYSDVKDPLFVSPIQVSLKSLRERLDKQGNVEGIAYKDGVPRSIVRQPSKSWWDTCAQRTKKLEEPNKLAICSPSKTIETIAPLCSSPSCSSKEVKP